jgi:hypothetical protein
MQHMVLYFIRRLFAELRICQLCIKQHTSTHKNQDAKPFDIFNGNFYNQRMNQSGHYDYQFFYVVSKNDENFPNYFCLRISAPAELNFLDDFYYEAIC